jgi:hypothetical protein
MSATTHSPADILRHALIAAGVGVLRSANTGAAWPVFAGHLPGSPDSAICVYDTAGKRDGRVMANASGASESITHPGWQIYLRANGHAAAWEKAKEVQAALDAIKQVALAIGGATYTVIAATQTGDVLSLGQEIDNARRERLTINGTLTFTQTQ